MEEKIKTYEELLKSKKHKTAIIEGITTLLDAMLELENSKYANTTIVEITITKKE